MPVSSCSVNETLLLCGSICESHTHTRGGAGVTLLARIIWLLGHTRKEFIWVKTLQRPARIQKQNADYSGETWVARKAVPISLRVAASLGEPMLGGHKVDQKRGALLGGD